MEGNAEDTSGVHEWSDTVLVSDNRSPFTFHSDGWFSGAKLSGRFRRNQVKESASKCKYNKHFNESFLQMV